MPKKIIQIAIDGPVAAGKGTVARLVAERLGITYIDTGAMYRVAAWLATQAGVDWNEAGKVAELVGKTKIEMRNPLGEEKDGRQVTIIVNDEDLSWKIRTEKMSQGSSTVSTYPQVRKVLVEKQQEIAKHQSVVMEGRDITFRVLPKAQLKIYLTADENERAERRYKQLLERGTDATFEKVLLDLRWRDAQDSGRKTDPLQITKDAWVLDTTEMGLEEVVEVIVERANKILGK